MLKNQVALITGGTAGIGKACALALSQQGATVYVVGTNRERGEAVAAECGGTFLQADVSDRAQIEAAVQQCVDRHQRIDILINNAGITRDQLLMRMPEADWDQVLATNLTACFTTCKAVLRPMMKARRGKIINVSSIVGITGNAGQCNYAASKAGIIGFSKSLAREVGSRNICVNCIAPGFIDTAMTHELPGKEQLLGRIPLGRFGTPADVAACAVFLASSGSDYITGQVLVVDGGLS